jgi:hypothetical protein
MPLDANDLAQIQKLITDSGAKSKDGKFTLDYVIVAVQQLAKQTKTTLADYDKRLTAPPDKKTEPDDNKKGETDLEKMSRAEFASHLQKEFAGEVKTLIEPILSGFSTLKNETGRTRLEIDVSEAEEKFGDLWDFEDEIKHELKRRPDLSVDEAYHLAKANNPDKTKEVDEKTQKAKNEAEKKEEDEKANEFLGFTPTSGKYAPDKAMDADKAASAAWDSTVKGTPAEKMLIAN